MVLEELKIVIKEMKKEVEDKENNLKKIHSEFDNIQSFNGDKTSLERYIELYKEGVDFGVKKGNKVIPVIGGAVGGLIATGLGLPGALKESLFGNKDNIKNVNKEELSKSLFIYIENEKNDIEFIKDKIKKLKEIKNKLKSQYTEKR